MHVTLHVMDAHPLSGHEAEARAAVATRYALDVKHELTRLEALAGGILARRVLGVTQSSQIVTNEHGKPRLAMGARPFNLSNDEGLVVLGVLDEGEGPIGVDLNEVPGPLDKPSLSVVQKYLRPEQIEAVGEGSTPQQRRAFALGWGSLEAPLKAMGTGFDFDVRHHREALDEWDLTPLGLDLPGAGGSAKSYVIVIAAHGHPELRLTMHDALSELGALTAEGADPRDGPQEFQAQTHQDV